MVIDTEDLKREIKSAIEACGIQCTTIELSVTHSTNEKGNVEYSSFHVSVTTGTDPTN